MKKYYKPAVIVITVSTERIIATSGSSNEGSSTDLEIGRLKTNLKKQRSEANQLKKRIKQLEETVDAVQKKHQQFQEDCLPYKRIPKPVKINKQAGTKECPKCKTENPMEANYCKHCKFSFWEYEACGILEKDNNIIDR